MFRQRKNRRASVCRAAAAATTRPSFRTQSGTSQFADRTRWRDHTYHGAVGGGGVALAGRPASSRTRTVLRRNAKPFLSDGIKISTSRRRRGGVAGANGWRWNDTDTSRLNCAVLRKQTSRFTQRLEQPRKTGSRRGHVAHQQVHVDGLCST